MYNNYLVTPTEVKTICPSVNQEIDDGLINGAILLMQDTILKNSLTLDMWEDIMVNSATTTNKYLIDNYIKNIIAYGVWQYLGISLSLVLNSAGLRIKVSDHSQAAESKDIEFYRSYIQTFIDNTRRLMVEYIDDHQTDYPLYYSREHGESPSVNNFRIGCVGNNKYYEEECDYRRTKK